MQCTSPIKWGKREKPRGKKPPPKKEMKEDAWMDGVIKTPPLWHTSNIYNREWWEEERQNRLPSPKEECRPMMASMKKLIHECWIVFLPLGRNNAQGIDETLLLCMEIIFLKEMSDPTTNEELCYNCWSWESTLTSTYDDRSCREWPRESDEALVTTEEGVVASRRGKASILSPKSKIGSER